MRALDRGPQCRVLILSNAYVQCPFSTYGLRRLWEPLICHLSILGNAVLLIYILMSLGQMSHVDFRNFKFRGEWPYLEMLMKLRLTKKGEKQDFSALRFPLPHPSPVQTQVEIIQLEGGRSVTFYSYCDLYSTPNERPSQKE